MFTAVAGGVAGPDRPCEVRGEIVANDVSVLKLAATKGVFADVVEEQVTYVNAPQLAADRGVEVDLATIEESPDHPNLVSRARHAARRPGGLGRGHADRAGGRSRS